MSQKGRTYVYSGSQPRWKRVVDRLRMFDHWEPNAAGWLALFSPGLLAASALWALGWLHPGLGYPIAVVGSWTAAFAWGRWRHARGYGHYPPPGPPPFGWPGGVREPRDPSPSSPQQAAQLGLPGDEG